MPGRNDGGYLSVDRGSMTSAKASFELHTQGKGLASQGVWAVIVGEVDATGAAAYEDPEPGPPANPAHAVIDLTGLGRGECERRAKKLAACSGERGCLFP